MSILINKSKLLLFFIFLFLSFLFLFNISGMSKNQQTSGIISHHLDWMQSLNKDIPALANRDNSLSVRQSFQQGNLLAIKLSGNQDYQGNKRMIEKIVAIDLSARKILFEKTFYDTDTGIGLYENYLIYSYKENDKKSYYDYKLKIIDLTKENREKEFKGKFEQITENGYIVCGFPAHLIDIKNGEIVFSHEYLKSYSPLLTTSGFFMRTKNEKGNWGGYQFINYHGEIDFSLPLDINITYLPRNKKNSTLSFPIPILNEVENEKSVIQTIDASGEVVDTYPLSEMGIPGTAFGQNHLPYGYLEILAKYEQKYILELKVYTEEEKTGKNYVIWLDAKQNQASVLEEDVRVMADFHATGHLIMSVENKGGFGHPTLKYYDPQGNCLWGKYLPPDIDGFVWFYPLNEESVLLYDNRNYFRCSLIDGQLTGVYPFPIDYSIKFAAVFDNQAYVLTKQGYNDTELEGNHLVSFSLGNTGWFDFELVKVSPLAGQPLTVYEDRKIDLEFQSGHYVLAEEQLEIKFDKGEVLDKSSSYGERWDCQWHSPELIDKDEETVNITATYGPISKNYQVVVKNLENPLILTGELKVNSRDPYQLILEGNIKNTAHLDIDDIDWQWELDNLNEIHSSFPKNIPAQKEKPFSMRLNRLAISEDQWEKIDWDGYEILQEVKLSCNYSEGQAEKIFEHSLNIQPEYSITLKLYDPLSQRNWSWNYLKELDLSNLKVWDERENDITSSLQVEKLSGNLIKINGLASGIDEKPVKIGVNYTGEIQWFELKSQSDKQPRFPKLTVSSFQFDLIASFPFPQPNGESIPLPRNPHIASGATFRGACGAGRPDSATSLSDIQIRVTDPVNDDKHYLLNYTRIVECGTHAGCRWHDACFDECAKNYGEEDFYETCHMYCNEQVAADMYGPEWGYSWQGGGGPYDGYFIYSDPPTWEGPFPGSVYSFPTANYRIDLDMYFFDSTKNKVNGYITLYGTDGTISTETLLDNYSEDELYKGNPNTFYVNMENFRDIERIKLRHENKGSGQEWYIDMVRIINMNNGHVWHFMVNKSLAESEESEGINQEFSLSYREETDYMIVVYTGDVDWEIGEGTDADIYISLIGENGTRTEKIFLDYPYANNFETGDRDVFDYIRTGDIGELDYIILRNDGSGIAPDWYCEKVDVHNRISGQAWHIPVNKWLTDENTPKTFFPE